jgi:CsoR family transcriptional regulator, copper-sensing transcriptional repressor
MTKKREAAPRRKPTPPARPDHSAQLARLKRIKGQIEGIQRMIEDRRYCPEILIQTSAARAALRSLEVAILRDHVSHCVKHALREPGGPDAKLNELLVIFQKLTA